MALLDYDTKEVEEGQTLDEVLVGNGGTALGWARGVVVSGANGIPSSTRSDNWQEAPWLRRLDSEADQRSMFGVHILSVPVENATQGPYRVRYDGGRLVLLGARWLG